MSMVQTLFQRLLTDPTYDPGLTAAEEAQLERVVTDGLGALQAGNEGQASGVAKEERALAESVDMLKAIMGRVSQTPTPPTDPIHSNQSNDPDMQRKIDELLGTLQGALQGGQDMIPNIAPPTAARALELEAAAIAQALSADSISKPFHILKEACPIWLERHGLTAPKLDLERVQHQFKIISELCDVYDTDPLFRPADTIHRDTNENVTPAEMAAAQGSLDRVVNLVQAMHDKGAPPQTLIDIVQEIQARDELADRTARVPE